MARLLRHKTTGEVYPVNADLLARGDMEEFDPDAESAEAEKVSVAKAKTKAADKSASKTSAKTSLASEPADLSDLDDF